jgi:predicted membrane-bound spermidine synthase
MGDTDREIRGAPGASTRSSAENPLPQALRWILFLAAFAAGFEITGIEIALGRLLAPHFGSSLTVWAAIIASVIGALSVGYPLGGWLADRRPGPILPLMALLGGGIFGAGLGIAVPHWLRVALAGVAFTGIEFWGRLSLALLLFSLPCILLATVPPAVLRMTLRNRTTTGRDAGALYALGSIGSVLGILLPALWWIPLLGLHVTFLLLGAAAVLPAALGLLSQSAGAWKKTSAIALLLFAALIAVPEAVRDPEDAGTQVLYDRDSGLQRIRVTARDQGRHRIRWLQLNEGWSVHSWLREPDYVTGDIWDWMALSALIPQPRDGQTDVLIVGLAGGTVSNLITRVLGPAIGDVVITGIELDPEVVAVADLYFDLDRSHLTTVVADGRVWLRGSTAKFDLIILDAYHQPSIPAHLATVEFFENVRSHLSADGLAVLNVYAPVEESRILSGIGATWSSAFPDAQWLRGPTANGMASHLLFGGPAVPIEAARIALAEIPASIRAGWRLYQRVQDLSIAPGVQPWTDDRAPIELLTDRAYRSLRPANPERPSA